jgi:hypothetical protein
MKLESDVTQSEQSDVRPKRSLNPFAKGIPSGQVSKLKVISNTKGVALGYSHSSLLGTAIFGRHHTQPLDESTNLRRRRPNMKRSGLSPDKKSGRVYQPERVQ